MVTSLAAALGQRTREGVFEELAIGGMDMRHSPVALVEALAARRPEQLLELGAKLRRARSEFENDPRRIHPPAHDTLGSR